MAIYHFNVSMVTRTKGHNVIAKASYINATKMENRETGQISDYSKKGDVIHTEISLPSHAPQEFKDSQTLWNSVLEVEKAKNSQLARRGDFALPLELSKEERIQLAREYIENTFVKSGMCVEWSYHDKPGNPHIDFIATVRPLKENGKWDAKKRSEFVLDKDGNKIPVIDPKTGEQKVRVRKGKGTEKLWVRKDVETTDWNKRETLEHWREEWANQCNKYLERHEHHEKLDHRSYEKQGIDKIPTIHEGYNARKMERQGNVSERCEENRSIKSANKELSKLSAERTNNELLTQIQLGYQKYQVINCIESANKIINDPIKSNNEHDMKLAQRYIDTAEKNLNRIYQDMNKLPKDIQQKYYTDLETIDLLRIEQDKVYFENFILPVEEKKLEHAKENISEPSKDPIKQNNISFNAEEHANKMMKSMVDYMNARYKYLHATDFNILDLRKNEVSHEYRDKLEQLKNHKKEYDNLTKKIERKSDDFKKLGVLDLKKKMALKNEISSLESNRDFLIKEMAEISRPHYVGDDFNYMRANQFTQESGYDTTIKAFEYEVKKENDKEYAQKQLPQLEVANKHRQKFIELSKQIPEQYKDKFIDVMNEASQELRDRFEDRTKAFQVWDNVKDSMIKTMPKSKEKIKEQEKEKEHERNYSRDR